ncbi:MAG: Ig-like domain repeat protein [Verrucomicrobiota bacterium]
MTTNPLITRTLLALAGLTLAAAPCASAALTSTTEIIGGNVVTKFTAGSGTWTVPTGVTSIQLLTVGGGGGGGTGGSAAGGGAGGLLYYGSEAGAVASSYAVTPGAAVSVTVGTGGTTGATGASKGSNSNFGTVTAVGGGAGGSQWSAASGQGGVGGSGGGSDVIPWGSIAGGLGTSGQGYHGGASIGGGQAQAAGGGGGGAGGVGIDGHNLPATGTNGQPGNGGPGLIFSISGGAVAYAGGGGGAFFNNSPYTGLIQGVGGSGSGNAGGGGTAVYPSGSTAGQAGTVIVSYPFIPLSVAMSAPQDNQLLFNNAVISATATVVAGMNGTAPFTVSYFTNFNGGTYTLAGSSGSPYSVSLGVLASGTYGIYATVTDSSATPVTATTATNTFVVVAPDAGRLALTDINGGSSPVAGTPFSVTVQVQNLDGSARAVTANTVVSLSRNTGSGTLGGSLTGTLTTGNSSVTISGVTYSKAESGVVLAATRTSGDILLPANSSAFSVVSGAATTLTVAGFPSPQVQGTAGSVTVTAKDSNGNVATGYTGTVVLTSNDGAATLPGSYAFVSGDAGVHAFGSVTLNTLGTRTLTATDTITSSITGTQSGISVVVLATTFNWTSTASGNWSAASNWTNNAGTPAAPATAGLASYVLNINATGTYTATSDLTAGFQLNEFNYNGTGAAIAGNSLTFGANGANLPQINENSANALVVTNAMALAANTTVGGTGSGQLVLQGLISGTGSLTKNGPGSLRIDHANTYSGGTTINTGDIYVFVTNTGLGTGPVTLNSGAYLSLEHVDFSNNLILNGGTINAGNGFGDSCSGTVALNSVISINAANAMLFSNTIRGAGGWSLTGGVLRLSATNTFSGPTSVANGTLQVASLNSVTGGAVSSTLGAPTTAANGTLSMGANSTLLYVGAGETTDRIIKLTSTTGGATLTQNGTGAGITPFPSGQSGLLKFTSNLLIPGSAGADNRKTLTLRNLNGLNTGNSPGQGEISGSIGDSLLGLTDKTATSVTMAGTGNSTCTGTWTLSGSNTYTGATKVQSGVLAFTRSNALGTGPLDISTGAKVRLDYIGTRQVSALTFNAGSAQANGTYGSSASTATFKDDTRFVGPGTVTVGTLSPTVVTLARTSGSNPSNGGAAVAFTATVAGSAPTGNVKIYDGLTLIGTSALDGTYHASVTTDTLTGGTHTLTAQYAGNAGNPAAASSPLTHTVNETRAATSTALSLTSGPNPSNLGTAVTFTATVTGASPTGYVTFYNGTTPLGATALNGSGLATLTTSTLAAGWRSITASYAGDATHQPGVSSPALFQSVTPPVGNGKVKVFILAGQSNMVGHCQVETGRNPNNTSVTNLIGGLGSLRHMLNANPNKYGYLADPANPTGAGNPGWIKRSDVSVTYKGDGDRSGILDANFGDNATAGQIGPEYAFGLVTGSQIGDQVLLIKYAFGGKSLYGDFRPPSSGGTVGPYYTGMVAQVRTVLNNLGTYVAGYAGQGYEITGFGWHQGWNDSGDTVAQYEGLLCNLIKDLRTEFALPNLPVVVANTGMAQSYCANVIQAQNNVGNPVLHPEFAGTVTTVDTRPFDFGEMLSPSSDATHWNWNAESYFNVGESMGLAMLALLPSATSLSPFDTWTSTQGLSSGVNTGLLDDPDHDGIPNIMEFALGGNPLLASRAILPALTQPSVGTRAFEYDRSAASRPPTTTQVVEYGSDLTGWIEVAIPAASLGDVTITTGSSSDHVKVAIPSLGTKGFARLKVSQ